MAQVVIRNIDEDAMRRLKSRAARKGVSLERELRTILTEAARADRTGFGKRAAAFAMLSIGDPKTTVEQWMGRLGGRVPLLQPELSSVGIGMVFTVSGPISPSTYIVSE